MNQVLQGHKFVANFLDIPINIGMICRMDDKQFIPIMSFNDAFPSIDLSKWTNSGSKADIKFSESKDVTFAFGAAASSSIGQSAVKMKFNRSRTAAGFLKNAVIDTLRYQNVLPQLKQIWNDSGYVKFLNDYIFVHGVVTAASGTLIYSYDSKNEVTLQHKLGNPVTGLADLGSGNFDYVSNTKRTSEIIRQVAHKPLFLAFHFKNAKDWQPEVLG